MSTSIANTTVTTSVATPVSRRSRFFLVMAVVLFVPVLVGFGPTFFFRPWSGEKDSLGGPFPVHLIIHGSVLSAWFLLLIVQTALVAAHRVDLHRRLGIIGVGLAVAVVVASSVTIVRVVPRATAIGVPAAGLIGVVVGDTEALVTFALFVAAAVYLKRRVAAHKRLMFLASNSIIGPALGRIHWIGERRLAPAFMLACIVALGVHDVLTRKRIHPATLVGIVAFFVTWVVLVFVAFGSGLGAAFVEWLR
jgi:hypothetical protein